MAIIESQLNGRIATLLGNLDRRWTARGENTGAFAGTAATPDILITREGAPPLVIENEYLPAYTVESEAAARLGARLDANVVNAAGEVRSAIALRSPANLSDCDTLDQVDALLRGGILLEYALRPRRCRHAGQNRQQNHCRPPKRRPYPAGHCPAHISSAPGPEAHQEKLRWAYTNGAPAAASTPAARSRAGALRKYRRDGIFSTCW